MFESCGCHDQRLAFRSRRSTYHRCKLRQGSRSEPLGPSGMWTRIQRRPSECPSERTGRLLERNSKPAAWNDYQNLAGPIIKRMTLTLNAPSRKRLLSPPLLARELFQSSPARITLTIRSPFSFPHLSISPSPITFLLCISSKATRKLRSLSAVKSPRSPDIREISWSFAFSDFSRSDSSRRARSVFCS